MFTISGFLFEFLLAPKNSQHEIKYIPAELCIWIILLCALHEDPFDKPIHELYVPSH